MLKKKEAKKMCFRFLNRLLRWVFVKSCLLELRFEI